MHERAFMIAHEGRARFRRSSDALAGSTTLFSHLGIAVCHASIADGRRYFRRRRAYRDFALLGFVIRGAISTEPVATLAGRGITEKLLKISGRWLDDNLAQRETCGRADDGVRSQ
jgi:hypothetical protein